MPPLGEWDDWLNMRLQHPDVAKVWHELNKLPEGASEEALRIW